jgi:hypothetical protein
MVESVKTYTGNGMYYETSPEEVNNLPSVHAARNFQRDSLLMTTNSDIRKIVDNFGKPTCTIDFNGVQYYEWIREDFYVMLNYLNWKKVNLIPDSRYGDIRTPSQ